MEKYIFLTGASSGIGKQIAVHLSAQYNLILNGRSAEKLSEVKSLCNPEANIVIWERDLSEVDSLEDDLKAFLKEATVEVYGFVHCAGFMKMAPLKMSGIKLLTSTFNTNVFAANIIIKVLSGKLSNGTALENVVFISSNISNRGAKGMSAYGASKAALDGLMRCLAVELAPRVRVNSVLPGAVVTEMTAAIFDNKEVADCMTASYPLGLGQPGDIADAVSFLLSSESRWITGQQLTVDGGRTIDISG